MSPDGILDDLTEKLAGLSFDAPVAHVYNPLDYAREPFEEYLRRYGRGSREVVLLGMNPGPWGMAQTGVPFGEVELVRDWLGIEGEVGKPSREHPGKPVKGFDCGRSEVSGRRLWGWARQRFGTPEAFFSRFFVFNYCPLLFLDEGGRNLTPNRLPAAQRRELLAVCDDVLGRFVERWSPELVVGVGAFAEARARAVLGEEGPRVGRILHPSPASPAANRGWAEQAEEELRALGVRLPS